MEPTFFYEEEYFLGAMKRFHGQKAGYRSDTAIQQEPQLAGPGPTNKKYCVIYILYAGILANQRAIIQSRDCFNGLKLHSAN